MEHRILDSLTKFNQLYKQMDETYHLYAKGLGVSDMTLWLFYSLYEGGDAYTQRELCSAWHYPLQTANSALKSLERQGIIALDPQEGNRKNKRIVLTKMGTERMHQIAAPLIQAEQRALENMTEAERAALLSLTRKYADLLQSEIRKI